MRFIRAIVVAAIAVLGFAVRVQAGPADLDVTFGSVGIVAIPFAAGSSAATAVVIQPDAKIVAAGYAGSDFALARCEPNGSLDPSFGVGGLVSGDFDGASDAAYALVRQADGKLVVAGTRSTPQSIVVARYEAAGSLDGTFGTGGHVVTPGASAVALVVQPDGKLVVGGTNASRFTLVRYHGDGTLDDTFGAGGIATTAFSGQLYALALQADGKVVAAGGAGSDIIVARFDVDGTLDPAFGDAGVATTPFSLGFGSTGAAGTGVTIQGDGKIVVAGGASTYSPTPHGDPVTVFSALVLRRTVDGALDTMFHAPYGGQSFTSGFATSLALQPDGKIVLAGGSSGGAQSSHLTLRVTADGQTDASFSGSSQIAGGANAVAVQEDRRIVAAGFGGSAQSPTFQIVRFNGGECGDAILDSGEICDDGNLTNGDGCDTNCTPTGCGNGIVSAGEACEPTSTEECACTAACEFVNAGTPCASDGELCATHACDGAGFCRHTVAPAVGCTVSPPGTSTIQLNDVTVRGRTVLWSWRRGPVSLAELADPDLTPYALCVYDHSGGTPALKMRLPLPDLPNPVWRASPSGFDYTDNTATYAGVKRVRLRTNAKAQGILQVKARGGNIRWLNPLPMTVDPHVTVQLRNAAGGCWSAEFRAPKQNGNQVFKAKSE